LKLKQHRFKKGEISAFLGDCQKQKCESFTVYFKRNQIDQNFAFIAPKRTGSAVKRNATKRQLKNAFLKINDQLKKDVSLILIANKKPNETDFKLNHNMLLLSLKKKDLIV
jgi:ribonuclease P protein component